MASFSGNGRVTDQIMDYYLRYGRDRDLEKFLRLRASTTRSSSDGSLPGLDELDRRGRVAQKLGKSMENLSTLRREEEAQERSRSREALSNNASGGSGKDKSGGADGKMEEVPPAQVVVKESKSEKKSGRNFNFNLESVIEIKLPPAAPAVQPAILVSPKQAVLASVSAPPAIHEISNAGTQTMPEARSVEQQTEEPIRPVLKPTTLNPEETIDTTRDISPVSSVASTKQKLEWDSLGDIGYDSNEKFYFCGASDLNETEKRCLQKYFAKKGLNFDEKIVVVKNVPAKKQEPEPPKETAKVDAKQKWQNVYQKYKEKYSNPSEISLVLMNPEAQSTPKPTQTSSQKSIPSRPAKSTQTSLVKILTKAIQADQIDTSHKQVGTSETLSSRTNVSTSAIDAPSSSTNCGDQGEAAESFEFFSSPPPPETSPQTAAKATVHQSPSRTTLKTSPEVSGVTTSSSSSSSSNTQQVSLEERSEYSFEDELRLGATLYNTICESRSLPPRVKQSLIDKIFRKMVKNDPRKRSKHELLRQCEALKKAGRREGCGEGEVVEISSASSAEEGNSKESLAEGESAGKDAAEQNKVSTASSERSEEDLIVQDLEEPSVRSNKATAPARVPSRIIQKSASSSSRTASSLPESSSKGTAREQRSETPKPTTPSDDIQASDQRIRKAMVDYLRPMTRSEVDYANQQDLQRQQKQQQPRPSTMTTTTVASSNGDRIFALFRKEKQSQLLKIEKKIEHLKSIKVLLLEEQKAVLEIEGDSRKSSDEKENLYENTEQRAKSAASAPVYTSVHGDTPNSGRSKEDTEFSSATRSGSAWNSHYHMKKLIQNRSKLETPSSEESIATFIKNRKDKFIENYERHRKRMFDEQNHIYTKPYSGRQSKQQHYSRLDEKYSIRKLAKAVTATGSAAQPSSDVFISSDSMSIPAANTLTNTTTHQYDIKSTRSSPESLTTTSAKATHGTQTTGSILRTKPIFESKPKATSVTAAIQVPSAVGCHCRRECPCRHNRPVTVPHTKHTEMIDGTHRKQDKQQQTNPSSIAYVITFQGNKSRPSSNGSNEKAQVYRSSSTDTSSEGSSTEMPNQESPDPELLPLKEQFKRNRPGTLARLKERQKCVNELNKLRSERNRQRKKLLLLTSDDSLKRCDVRQKLPPPPLAQKRIFSSRAIRENTRRQVRNLPEVLRKKEIEKVNNLKRKNLILRDKFNRNLQRKVLHGQVDLSNSVRVMQD